MNSWAVDMMMRTIKDTGEEGGGDENSVTHTVKL